MITIQYLSDHLSHSKSRMEVTLLGSILPSTACDCSVVWVSCPLSREIPPRTINPSSCRRPLDVETGTMFIELKCWEGVEEEMVTIWTFCIYPCSLPVCDVHIDSGNSLIYSVRISIQGNPHSWWGDSVMGRCIGMEQVVYDGETIGGETVWYVWEIYY